MWLAGVISTNRKTAHTHTRSKINSIWEAGIWTQITSHSLQEIARSEDERKKKGTKWGFCSVRVWMVTCVHFSNSLPPAQSLHLEHTRRLPCAAPLYSP